jgi:hypothetical protein
MCRCNGTGQGREPRGSASDFGSGEILGPRSAKMANLPQGVKLVKVLPNWDGSQAACLWEDEQTDVKAFRGGHGRPREHQRLLHS